MSLQRFSPLAFLLRLSLNVQQMVVLFKAFYGASRRAQINIKLLTRPPKACVITCAGNFRQRNLGDIKAGNFKTQIIQLIVQGNKGILTAQMVPIKC